ncbi:MAG: RodZ domain-containing protein [Pseudomonadota bacterium]
MENSEPAETQPQRPGDALRAAREAAGIAPREMADRLNWLPSHLSAIEANRFEDLRSQAFVRGYLRAYAKALGLEEAPLVDSYNALADTHPRSEEDEATAAAKASSSQQNSGQWIAASLMFAALIVLIFWWRGQPPSRSDAAQSAPPVASTVNASAPITASSSQGEAVAMETAAEPPLETESDTDAAGASLELAAVDGGDISVAESSLAPNADALAGGPGEAGVPATGMPATELSGTELSGTGVPATVTPSAESLTGMPASLLKTLEFSFSDECWLEVKDGKDKLIYSDLKAAGDTLRVSGEPPFRIVAGNAAAVSLRYRGEVVVIKSPPGRNLARVTVGEDQAAEL